MLTGYLRQRRRTLLAFFLFGGIFAAAFALYQLPLRAVAYPFVLCAAAGAVLLALDYRRVLRQHRRLELLRQLPEELADALPPADTVKEADYRSLVTLLAESRRAIRTQEEQRYGDMVDYYTMWAHQIKTPIASMRLTLQNEDSGLARSLSGDLMRVEQYVEMVLVFLRLDSSTTDYVIRSHSLDDIVRPAVRKFAGEFIRRRLRLDYQPLDRTVVTDAKWLGFVVEQVLSNALKYTVRGVVFFYLNTFPYVKQLKIYIKLTLKNCRILPLARSKPEVYSMKCDFSVNNFTKPMRTPEKVNFFRV